jgi:hypothetical protein
MAGSVNKVILIGNLGKDPEIRRLESGVTVASFTLATSENYLDKNSGERKEITDWHDIVMWRGLAEVAEKYLKKGMKIYEMHDKILHLKGYFSDDIIFVGNRQAQCIQVGNAVPPLFAKKWANHILNILDEYAQ